MSLDNNPNSYEEMLRSVTKNAELFSSDELSEHVRQKHFSNNVPIYYVDPKHPDKLIEEFPDGTKKRTTIATNGNGTH